MATNDENACLDALERVAATGQLGELEIEVWSGGGQPPPYYRSDQFLLRTRGGRDVQTFARPLFYPGRDPETLVERFLSDASPDLTRGIARLILEAEVFARRFPEEDDPGGADAFSTEVILTLAGSRCQRRYFRRVPDAVEPLLERVRQLIERLRSSGRRALLDQGREVAAPPVTPFTP